MKSVQSKKIGLMNQFNGLNLSVSLILTEMMAQNVIANSMIKSTSLSDTAADLEMTDRVGEINNLLPISYSSTIEANNNILNNTQELVSFDMDVNSTLVEWSVNHVNSSINIQAHNNDYSLDSFDVTSFKPNDVTWLNIAADFEEPIDKQEYTHFTKPWLVVGVVGAGMITSISISTQESHTKDSFLLNGTDMSVGGSYTLNNLKIMYDELELNSTDTVQFVFILNRQSEENILDSDYLAIKDVLALSYSEQQSYINIYQTMIPEWYGASQTDMDVVTQFLKSNGFSIDYSNLEQRTITAQGSVEDFKNTFLSHHSDSQVYPDFYYGLDGVNSLTINNPIVSDLIMGISHFQQINNSGDGSNNSQSSGVNYSSSNNSTQDDQAKVLYPSEIASMYQFPANKGEGNTIGIVATANFNVSFASKLDDFVKVQHPGLDYSSQNQVITIGEPIPEQFSFIDEFSLDISVISSVAPKAHIIELSTNAHDPSLYGSYALGIYNSQYNINIISSSEANDLSGQYQFQIYESLYQDALLRDISFINAVGDLGVSNAQYTFELTGQPNLNVDSGAPSMLSVGGTSYSKELTEGINRLASEIEGFNYPSIINNLEKVTETDQTTWNQSKNTLAYYNDMGYTFEIDASYKEISEPSYLITMLSNSLTSSGQFDPTIYPMPSYQTTYLAENFTGGRIAPDISFLAGGKLYLIVTEDGLIMGSGTSAAGPLTAALIALTNTALQEAHNDDFDGSLGFINPLLYEAYAADASFFIDIPVGSNNANIATIISPEHIDSWDGMNAMISHINYDEGTIDILPITAINPDYYQTADGFDYATGLGSINGLSFYDYIDDTSLWMS